MQRKITVDDFYWAPPEWTLCGFPLAGPGVEEISLLSALDTLYRLADTITEADSTALGPAMHVAHMLVMRQGEDGRWPADFNARTGEALGTERTSAPLTLFDLLARELDTIEFDHVIEFARKAH